MGEERGRRVRGERNARRGRYRQGDDGDDRAPRRDASQDLKQAGDTAKLGQTIGIIGKKGEDFSALLDEASSNGRRGQERRGDEGTRETRRKRACERERRNVAKQGEQELKERSPKAKTTRTKPTDRTFFGQNDRFADRGANGGGKRRRFAIGQRLRVRTAGSSNATSKRRWKAAGKPRQASRKPPKFKAHRQQDG